MGKILRGHLCCFPLLFSRLVRCSSLWCLWCLLCRSRASASHRTNEEEKKGPMSCIGGANGVWTSNGGLGKLRFGCFFLLGLGFTGVHTDLHLHRGVLLALLGGSRDK